MQKEIQAEKIKPGLIRALQPIINTKHANYNSSMRGFFFCIKP